MKNITNIFICLLIALTTNVLNINVALADDKDNGRPVAVFNDPPEKITLTESAEVFEPDEIYSNDSTAPDK